MLSLDGDSETLQPVQVLHDACVKAEIVRAHESPAIAIRVDRQPLRQLFCVPGAGANVTCFMSLAEAFDDGISVYGLQPRGMDGVQAPHTTVTAAAESYVAALKGIGRKGPRVLLGHSFGGWVAFEMACQLAAAGEDVKSVVLLDTRAPTVESVKPRYRDRVAIVMKLIRVLEQANDKCLNLDRGALEGLSYERQLIKLAERMRATGIISRGVKMDTIRNLVHVFSINVNTSYVPAYRFAGEIILMQAQETSRYEVDEDAPDDEKEFSGWKHHATAVSRLKLPGNHMTMLQTSAGSMAACVQELG